MTTGARRFRYLIASVAAIICLAVGGAAGQGNAGRSEPSQQPKSTADAWRQALPQQEEPDPSATVVSDIRRDSAEETREAVERRLGELEQSWADALRTGDAESLRRLLAADFTHAGASTEGATFTLGKADYVAHALRGAKLNAHTLDQIKVRIYDGAAVVSGLLVRSEANAPGATTADFAFTDVWVRRAGVWRAVSRHLSSVPAEGAAKD
jgi:hypothetical protein